MTIDAPTRLPAGAHLLALDKLHTDLPGLATLVDVDAVARRFVAHWPGEGWRSPVEVVGCRLQRVTYEPGRRAVAVYRLEVTESGGAARRTLGVLELSAAGLRHRLFEDDTALGGLTEAVDADLMADRLADLVDRPVAACVVEPISYQPGRHCVLRYELHPAGGGPPIVLFAKAYAEGAAAVASTLVDLHRCGAGCDGFAVAAPLACLPDLGLVVQPQVDGRSLGHRLFGGSSSTASRRSAAGAAGLALAALQAAAGPPGPAHTLADDLDELWAQHPVVAQVDRALARRMAEILDRLGRAEMATAAPVPGHGSFRADHIVLQGGRVHLIDLDGYRWAEPARDVANLLAYLRWKARREPQHAPAVAEARAAFLSAYDPSGGLDDARCAVYEAASALKIAIRRYRRLAVDEWSLVPSLVESAAALLRGRDRVRVS